MKSPAEVEMVCCREVHAGERQGPCIAMAVAAALLRARSSSRRATCDRHNRQIVLVQGARFGAARP